MMGEATRSKMWDAFESGYMQGHNDTVESCVRDSKEAACDYFESIPSESVKAKDVDDGNCVTCELAEENERLREDAAKVFINELVYKDGKFDATMKTGFGSVLAAFVREMMKAYKGENFVTTSLSFSDDIDAYYITFGRKYGKSVAEKYVEVCAERDAALDRLAERAKA